MEADVQLELVASALLLPLAQMDLGPSGLAGWFSRM